MTILILLVCGLSLTECQAVEHPESFASRAECMRAIPEARVAVGGTVRRAECVERIER